MRVLFQSTTSWPESGANGLVAGRGTVAWRSPAPAWRSTWPPVPVAEAAQADAAVPAASATPASTVSIARVRSINRFLSIGREQDPPGRVTRFSTDRRPD